MKMLFYSSDHAEVERVSREFALAGITCEVRHFPSRKGKPVPDAELWIRNDRDCHRAFMLCVRLGIGFARRPHAPVDIDAEPDHKAIA
jgi:diadenosine tetraphosphatase ApaH/serine/threonine PP2A family protein phosphatase